MSKGLSKTPLLFFAMVAMYSILSTVWRKWLCLLEDWDTSGVTLLCHLASGYSVVVIDSLVNSKRIVKVNIETVAEKEIIFHEINLTNYEALLECLTLYKGRTRCVIHFASLKAVGESVEFPLMYYHNNIIGSIHLFEAMKALEIKNIVFSSSATVYGDPKVLPLTEDHPLDPVNPYAKTKVMIESMLEDFSKASPVDVVALRYFNPIGAHPSGIIGESPNGIPNNLLPYVAQVCSGVRPFVRIYGNDYATPDGTGLRDYIHVCDLADGHVAAMKYLINQPRCGFKAFNLGTGKAYSVLEVIKAMENASGKTIPTEIHPRREGDVASSYADCSLSEKELCWKAKYNLEDMCRDLWNYQSKQTN